MQAVSIFFWTQLFKQINQSERRKIINEIMCDIPQKLGKFKNKT
jgi:hypothetical protein